MSEPQKSLEVMYLETKIMILEDLVIEVRLKSGKATWLKEEEDRFYERIEDELNRSFVNRLKVCNLLGGSGLKETMQNA